MSIPSITIRLDFGGSDVPQLSTTTVQVPLPTPMDGAGWTANQGEASAVPTPEGLPGGGLPFDTHATLPTPMEGAFGGVLMHETAAVPTLIPEDLPRDTPELPHP